MHSFLIRRANMNISNIADWLQIGMFVASVGAFIIASVSKKSRAWFKSIFSECLYDFFNKSSTDDDEK